MIPDERLDKIEERAKVANPSPCFDGGEHAWRVNSSRGYDSVSCERCYRCVGGASLLIAVRSSADVPALVAEVRSLRATLALRDECMRLEGERNEAQRERDALLEEIDEWKEASGLLIGGDPGGVEPKHVAAEMALHSALFHGVRETLQLASHLDSEYGRRARDTLPAIAAMLDDTIGHTAIVHPAVTERDAALARVRVVEGDNERLEAERDAAHAALDAARLEVASLRLDLQASQAKCPVHGTTHGGEAEELRAGVEHCLDIYLGRDLQRGLLELLDRVNARDSLAHLENVERFERALASDAGEALLAEVGALRARVARWERAARLSMGQRPPKPLVSGLGHCSGCFGWHPDSHGDDCVVGEALKGGAR